MGITHPPTRLGEAVVARSSAREATAAMGTKPAFRQEPTRVAVAVAAETMAPAAHREEPEAPDLRLSDGDPKARIYSADEWLAVVGDGDERLEWLSANQVIQNGGGFAEVFIDIVEDVCAE